MGPDEKLSRTGTTPPETIPEIKPSEPGQLGKGKLWTDHKTLNLLLYDSGHCLRVPTHPYGKREKHSSVDKKKKKRSRNLKRRIQLLVKEAQDCTATLEHQNWWQKGDSWIIQTPSKRVWSLLLSLIEPRVTRCHLTRIKIKREMSKKETKTQGDLHPGKCRDLPTWTQSSYFATTRDG